MTLPNLPVCDSLTGIKMILVEYTPNFKHFSKKIKDMAGVATMAGIAKKVFTATGNKMKQTMSGNFSSFTGATKGAVMMKYGGYQLQGEGTFTVMSVGIPAGKLSRDKGFFENMDRRTAYTKAIPYNDPDFRAWIKAHFHCRNEREVTTTALIIGKRIMAMQTKNNRPGMGRKALEKAWNENKDAIDRACSDLLAEYVRMMASDSPSAETPTGAF